MENGDAWENWSAFTICTGIDTLIWGKFTQIQINQFATMFSTCAASLVVSVLSRASTRNFLLCMRPPGISRLEIVAAARLMFTQGIVETADVKIGKFFLNIF